MPEKDAGRERLLRILFEGSFRYEQEPVFTLSAGVSSRYYIDCKIALSNPEARKLIGGLIYDRVRGSVIDAVGGMELGAYPVAVAVSDAMYRTSQQIARAFVVRKHPKKHGMKRYIEGDVHKGDKALIVEDVVTSGKSTVEAIAKARTAGLEIVRVAAIIDRQECDGRNNIESQGVSFEALFTLEELKGLVGLK